MKQDFRELASKGYELNGEKQEFYVREEHKDRFQFPEGYEGWDLVSYDPAEYYANRISGELGITEDQNNVELYGGPNLSPNERTQNKIFTHNQYGDIEILMYSLDRKPFLYASKDVDSTSSTNQQKYDVITRFCPRREDIKGRKYDITGKTGIHPFIHPELIRIHEDDKADIETLIITEGYLKAFKACMNEIWTVGLSSITHYKDKKTASIHPDIIDLIRKNNVKNVVILWDGDCLDMSVKALGEGEDLYKRPAGFFHAVKKMQRLLKEYISKHTRIYFGRILSEQQNDNPKGLDDLIVALKDEVSALQQDFTEIGARPGRFIFTMDITVDLKQLQQYFHINKAEDFYHFHQEKIEDREFIFNGTKYQWSTEQKSLEVKIPAAAKHYSRIGVDYYKSVMMPDAHGHLHKHLVKWSRMAILEDHGKAFLNHVPRYEGFVNVPDHDNFQQVISNCWNMYYAIEHEVADGSFPKTKAFLQHIFQEHYEMALDYVQIMWTKPQQPLPIVCLVSRENATGKSTFAHWLKEIFVNNMAIVGNAELSNDFNSGWASKLIVCCDEAFIEKKVVVEKIKSLSTAKRIMVNAKGKDLKEIDFFAKFILITNNEENFIYADDNDTRYWVRKVAKLSEEQRDPMMMDHLIEELPHFLYFLQNRKLSVPEAQDRMWFKPSEIKTDALKKVIRHSAPTIEKEMRNKLVEMFLDFGLKEIEMTTADVKRHILNGKYEENYINRIIKDHIGAERKQNKEGVQVVCRYKFPTWDQSASAASSNQNINWHKGTGRPFIFTPEMVLTEDVLKKVDNQVITQQELAVHNVASEAEDDLPF